jgi:hypothetical protein
MHTYLRSNAQLSISTVKYMGYTSERGVVSLGLGLETVTYAEIYEVWIISVGMVAKGPPCSIARLLGYSRRIETAQAGKWLHVDSEPHRSVGSDGPGTDLIVVVLGPGAADVSESL